MHWDKFSLAPCGFIQQVCRQPYSLLFHTSLYVSGRYYQNQQLGFSEQPDCEHTKKSKALKMRPRKLHLALLQAPADLLILSINKT